MLEAPEARLIAVQLNERIRGKRITTVVAGHSPHKFAWFWNNDPAAYEALLTGKTVGDARAVGGLVEVAVEQVVLIFGDGANLRYYAPGATLPPKHQLLIGFADESCIVASVRMYGALLCFPADAPSFNFTPYYECARSKPQVMSEEFTREYFDTLIGDRAVQNKSAKAFLATEQRIPGLGNGVLQDILYNAGVHPKTKVDKLPQSAREAIYSSVVDTLRHIYASGGRNTESDLDGRAGGYIPYLSKDTAGCECTRCGSVIIKENYMGGSIYYCPGCQRWER